MLCDYVRFVALRRLCSILMERKQTQCWPVPFVGTADLMQAGAWVRLQPECCVVRVGGMRMRKAMLDQAKAD
ncbi:hypothetical protein XOCgx_1442 [Xanthomonas oryzae pv. oryzicola]|nr:hypothetical protein XOCgx_1442 [Xanthomonas oryzae pv. oryzicola]